MTDWMAGLVAWMDGWLAGWMGIPILTYIEHGLASWIDE